MNHLFGHESSTVLRVLRTHLYQTNKANIRIIVILSALESYIIHTFICMLYVAATTTKIIIFGAAVDNTCERDRQRERESKGDFVAVLLFKVRFQKLYIMQNIQFCVCSLHKFSNFFPWFVSFAIEIKSQSRR